jgi:uncharacterized protein (TIRG00374 family)
MRAFRWRALLAPLTESGLRALFISTTIGFAAVFLFGRAGEVVRPVVLPLRDRRVRPAASFVTIMIERICDSVAVVILFAVSLLFVAAPPGRASEFSYVRDLGLALLVASVLGLVGLAWFRRSSKTAVEWLEKRFAGWPFIHERFARAVTHTLAQLATALGILADLRELLRVSFWTMLLWGSVTIADWLVLKAFGLKFGLPETIFVMGFALVGSLVPTPGGAAGAFHTATAVGLIFLGVPKDEAAAIAILTHLIVFSPALIFGLYYLLRGEINLSRLRELIKPEAVEHAVEDDEIELNGHGKDEKYKVHSLSDA